MDDRSDAFLSAAVERSWITPEQAEEARRIHATVAEVGVEQRIEDILVKKGFLTPERARKLKRELAKKKVGKYQIVEKLGEGGAGIVYKANQEPLERIVAIKVLSAERVLSPKYLERFTREARIAVTLNHANIVRGLDYGEADGYHYFVMEYVKGDSLFQVLSREGTMSERKSLQVVLQVVAALEHAAKYDLVHRDIKPENILITPDEVVKLCDLGLAKPSLVETAKASKSGTTIGTPTYMSPEQIRGKDDTDFRSDVYSLGATLYHMIAGRPPFRGESADIVVRKHLRETVTDPRELNVALSSSIAAIVLKMLAKKPEDRYPSLGSLREDLEAVLDGRPPRNTIELGGKRPTGAVKVDVADDGHRRERIAAGGKRSKAPIYIAIVAVVLAAAGFFALDPFGKKEEPAKTDPDLVNRPDVPTGPSPEEEAEEAYREALDWVEKNAGVADAVKTAKFKSVADRHPDTRWALHAKERIREIAAQREQRAAAHRTKAGGLYDQTVARAKAMAAEKKYGDALAELATYPEGYEDTEFPERLKKDAERMTADAREEFAAAVEKAQYELDAGRPGDAIPHLEPFTGYGIPSIEKDAKGRIEKIRGEIARLKDAREKGMAAYRAAVGEAFLKAARGEWSEARNHLVSAQESPQLDPFSAEIRRADAQLRDAMRFDDGLRKGAGTLVGKVEKFHVTNGKQGEVGGKILDVLEDGLKLSKTGGSRKVPFASMASSDLIRLAFLELDNDSVDDHRAAAIYLVVHTRFAAVEEEIEAARILGADIEPIAATKDLFSGFLTDHADRFIRQAKLRFTQERWKEAYELLEQAVGRAPWYPRPHLFRGQVLVMLGRPEDAVEALELAAGLGEKDPELHYWLGEAWLAQEKLQKALAEFTKYADRADNGDKLEKVRDRINDLRSKALGERIANLKAEAKKAQRKRDWARVAEIYREVLELDPDDHASLYLLGKAELEKKDILAAYDALRQFLDTKPSGRSGSDAKKLVKHLEKTYREAKDTTARLTDANQQLTAGRYDGALTLCEMAIEEAPLNEDAYYTKAMVHYRLGERNKDSEEFAKCLEELENVLILNPTQPLVHELRAIVYYYLEKPDEALASAESAIREVPERWQSYNIAGLVHKEKGRHEKAIQVLTLGIRKAPNEAVLYQNRALAWESMGRIEKALADVEAGLKKRISNNRMQQLTAIKDRLLAAKEAQK
ncbi:MAG: protein kinase [Planctomycetota bacterium]